MSNIDWFVLAFTIISIVVYGIWKSRGTRTIDTFLLADRKFNGWYVGFSVMATQASAITFLSTPGQGFTDGLRFVQFYFGLPLAMIAICIWFIPVYKSLNVFTAYEFLEKRFDRRIRLLTSALFLLQRALSTGITIYAPALVLSTILNTDILSTTVLTGCLVILYTVYGGTKAVSHTQLLQMTIIFAGLILAAVLIVNQLPTQVGFMDALHLAGKMQKLQAIDLNFDINNRYNIWSGIIGGFFLQLSYFGTDQSQVGRYLTGSSESQSRWGLIMNGFLKIPMQFLILLMGVLVYICYIFYTPPVFFNKVALDEVKQMHPAAIQQLQIQFDSNHKQKKETAFVLVDNMQHNDTAAIAFNVERINRLESYNNSIRDSVKLLIKQNQKISDSNDGNYIFLSFVMSYLPQGLIGLLIAIIFLSAMGATASGLNALTSTCIVDFYKPFFSDASPSHYLKASRWVTFAWGIFCIVTALYASRLGNLIEAVNIMGSLFYGTILGIFCVAFFCKWVGSIAVFYAAVLTEIIVVATWWYDVMAFLWLNVLGCLWVVLFAIFIERIIKLSNIKSSSN